MRINQIRQILEIEKCTSISQAARNLFISQPSLSAVLNEFEKEIGVQLFTRTKQGVIPTQDGEMILESMKTIMHEVDFIKNYTINTHELTGILTFLLGASYEFLYSDLIARFKNLFPKAKLNFINTYDSNVIDKINKELVDFAILSFENVPETSLELFHQNTSVLTLRKCHSFVVLDPHHKLCQHDSIVFDQLSSEQLILGAQYRDYDFNSFLSLDIAPITNIDRSTALALVAQHQMVFLDGSPLQIEEYQKLYPKFVIRPLIAYNPIFPFYFEWQTAFFYRAKPSNKLQKLFLPEIINLLNKFHLIQPSEKHHL